MPRRLEGHITNITIASGQTLPSDISSETVVDPINDGSHLFLFEAPKKAAPFNAQFVLGARATSQAEKEISHSLSWSQAGLTVTLETGDSEEAFAALASHANDGLVRSTKLFIVDEAGHAVGQSILQSQTTAMLAEWQRKGVQLQETLSPIQQIIHHYNNGRMLTEERLLLVAKLPKGTILKDFSQMALPSQTIDSTTADAFLNNFNELYLHAHYGTSTRRTPQNGFAEEALTQAEERLETHRNTVRHTPTYEAPLLTKWTGADQVLIKAEAEQNQGSFKVRGATNFLQAHIDGGLIPSEHSVVAASHGNHAQGVVLAANTLGFANTILVLPLAQQTQKNKIRACLEKGALVFLYGNDPILGSNLAAAMSQAKDIEADGLSAQLESVTYLPGSATDTQIDALIANGQNVILYGAPNDTSLTPTQVEARARGIGNHPLFIPTYDHELIATGQATVAMEIISDHPELLDGQTTVIIPAGGGGLFAGMGAYFTLANPNISITGVNSDLVPVISRSLAKGTLDLNRKEIAADEGKKKADGTDVPDAGKVTVAEIIRQKKELGNRSAVLVTEDEIAEAMVFADSQPWYNGRTQHIEGAAALSLAAALGGAAGDLTGKRIVLTVSGRNIDDADRKRLRFEKNWLIENPELYRYICELRKSIRSAFDGEKAIEWLHHLDTLMHEEPWPEAFLAIVQSPLSEKNQLNQGLCLIMKGQVKLQEIMKAVEATALKRTTRQDELTGLELDPDDFLKFIQMLPMKQPLPYARILSNGNSEKRLEWLNTLYLIHKYPPSHESSKPGFTDILNQRRIDLLTQIEEISSPAFSGNLKATALHIAKMAGLIFSVIESCNICNDKASRAAIAGLLHDVRGVFQGLDFFPNEFTAHTTRADRYYQLFEDNAKRLSEALSAPIYPFFNTPSVQDFVMSTFTKTARAHIKKYSPGKTLDVTVTEAAQTLKASADPALTRLVIQNLASNAAKYGQPPFEMGYDPNAESFYFKNEGVIPENALAHLFEYGFRASNIGNNEGQGIGLANVKSYVERMGGNVSVISDAGNGTIFRIRLPLALEGVSPLGSYLFEQLQTQFTKQLTFLSPENDAALTQYLNDLLLFRRNRLSRLLQQKQSEGLQISDAEVSRLCEMIFADVPALLAAASPSYTQMMTPTPEMLVQDARHIGETLLPKNHAEYGIQPDQPAKLDEARIISIADSGQELPNLLLFDRENLSNRFEPNGRGGLKKISDGIHTWQDLLSVISRVMETKPQKALLLEIRQEEFPTLHPSPEFLAGLQSLVLDSERTITLVVHGAAAKPSEVYTATRDGVIATPMGDELTATNAWLKGSVRNRIIGSLTDRNDQRALRAFENISDAHPTVNRATYLELVWQKLSQIYGNDFRRTQIFTVIKSLREKLNHASQAVLRDARVDLSPRERAELLAANPIDNSLRAHPTPAGQHRGLYSIGAGQMLGVMEPARKLMDEGLLPLDYDLASNDLNEALTREINEDGTNGELLGKTPINPGDTVDIHVSNAFQKAELLLQGYDVVFLNLKGKFVASAVDEILAKIVRATHSILATPTKSHHNDGTSIVPYISIYKKLEDMGYKDIADRFIVMAGFFEAKKLLAYRAEQDEEERNNNRVDMAFIGADPEALVTLATVFSDSEIDELRRVNTDWMNLKGIPESKVAAFAMAGGANKNFLTYRAGRLLMRDVFALSDTNLRETNLGTTFGLLSKTLNRHKETNITESDAFSARLLASHGMKAYHLWSPEALKEDIRRCLPDHVVELIKIRLIADRILTADVNRLNLDFFTETRTSDFKKYPGLDLTVTDLAKAQKRLSAAITASDGSDTNIRLSYLDELLEQIRIALKKSGTRNSRDGLLDETIAYFYSKLTGKNAWGEEFRTFRAKHYPLSWTGANAQEGRNGIGDAVKYVEAHHISVSPAIAEAEALYGNLSPKELAERIQVLSQAKPRAYLEAERLYSQGDIEPSWGLEAYFIMQLFQAVSLVIMSMKFSNFTKKPMTTSQLNDSLDQILVVLNRLKPHQGIFAEVTDPLCELTLLLQRIQERLHKNGFDPNNLTLATQAFEDALKTTNAQFNEEALATHQIADNIRVLCQKFYWVDLYLQGLVGIEKTLVKANVQRTNTSSKRVAEPIKAPITLYNLPNQKTREALTSLMGGDAYQPALQATLHDHNAAERLQQQGARLMIEKNAGLTNPHAFAIGARNLSGHPLSAVEQHKPAAMAQHPSLPLARRTLPAHIQARSLGMTRSIIARR
jgi:threonine dehydratase